MKVRPVIAHWLRVSTRAGTAPSESRCGWPGSGRFPVTGGTRLDWYADRETHDAHVQPNRATKDEVERSSAMKTSIRPAKTAVLAALLTGSLLCACSQSDTPASGILVFASCDDRRA